MITDVWPLGGDRVGILIDDDSEELTELLEPAETTTTVVWVDGCLFEIQTSAVITPGSIEQNADTTTVREVAFCFMPVADGLVPAVDDDGEPVPVAAGDITSTKVLRRFITGLDYQMRGDAVLEVDNHGREKHVFALCERPRG